MARRARTIPAGTVGTDGNAGTVNLDPITVDPADYSGGADNGNDPDGRSGDDNGNASVAPERRKRAYTRRKSASASPGLSVDSIALTLRGIHAGLATLTNNKIWSLDDEEAKVLATSVANVSRHYDLQQTEKSIDWFNLFVALGSLYGAKLAAYRMMRAAEKEAAKDEATVVSYPFGGKA